MSLDNVAVDPQAHAAVQHLLDELVDSICDWDATCARIAALQPIYPVGQPAYRGMPMPLSEGGF